MVLYFDSKLSTNKLHNEMYRYINKETLISLLYSSSFRLPVSDKLIITLMVYSEVSNR